MAAMPLKRRFWSPYLLGAVTIVALVLLWRGVGSLPTASAQVPDSGAQRVQMIAELRSANVKLSQIVKLLTEIRDQQRAAGSPAAGQKGKPRR